ncbi:ribonuclease H [Trichonephila clavipes]|nr:ribonuclease H [Trichonephila clavipes]
MTTLSDANYQRIIGAGAIAFCSTCDHWRIIEALDLYEILPILEQAKGLVIFCDSKAALQAILNGGSWITKQIFSRLFRLQELDKLCFLQWLSTHFDTPGSENADKLAKEARNLNKD